MDPKDYACFFKHSRSAADEGNDPGIELFVPSATSSLLIHHSDPMISYSSD